ncbi:ribosomal protein S7, putative [Leishmania tarentolae]|uniref:Ribosomal protein S7, putative n=1 Tax=Leishmania tarentolae TaxID=5689 RepID=A0A640KD00_LEITA|nr:ribosomal protein S7, putative [Leishmania tarentolae]
MHALAASSTSLPSRHLLQLRVPHEAERHAAVRQLLVHVRHSAEAGLDTPAVARVQEYLHQLAPVRAVAPAAAHHIARVDHVVQNILEHCRARLRALHLLQLVHVRWALRDLPLRDQHHQVARVALLQLGGERALNLAHQHQEAQGVEDDHHRLLRARHLHLTHRVDVEARQFLAQRLVRRLELEQRLRDALLEAAGLAALQLTELAEMRLHDVLLSVRGTCSCL